MNARNLGFMSSWHMLTRDKGWIKPMLVLTLVGWIPILGQIVLLGYGMEWARLTAWGVDSAPKQRNVDYGKVLSTGGRAFLVNLSLGFVCALVLQILFPGSLAWLASGLMGMNAPAMTLAASGVTASLIMLVATIFIDTFLRAASLRATIYDDFTAGWRLDRLVQMIGRDFGGFCKAWLVSAIGSVVSGAYAAVVGIIGGIAVMGGALGIAGVAGLSGAYSEEYIIHQLITWGAGPALLFVVLAIFVAFVGGVIATSMSMVSMNAMGQWFCRFEVNRWGLSGDPLPADVPHRDAGWTAAAPSTPADPTAAAQGAAPAAAAAPSAAEPSQPAAPAEPAAPASASASPAAEPVQPLVAPAPAEPIKPLDAPNHPAIDSAHQEKAEQSAMGEAPTLAEEPPVSVMDEEAAREAAEEAARSVAAEAAARDKAEPEAVKKPIPLGPISTSDPDPEDEGPISV